MISKILQNGQYKILQRLQEGISGIAYLAVEVNTNQQVFIKGAYSRTFHARENLNNEELALRKMNGIGVPKLLNSFTEVVLNDDTEVGEAHFIAMEYLGQNNSIDECFRDLHGAEKLEIIRQLFKYLSIAHEQGLSHGDIDLKHLYWIDKYSQLKIIDWGNSRFNTNDTPHINFDMFRAAEVVYALIAHQKITVASEISNNLPSNIPDAFIDLLLWAQKQNQVSVQEAPHKSIELYSVAELWLKNGFLTTNRKDQKLQQADDAYYSGNFDQAIDLYQEILEENPSDEHAQKQYQKVQYARQASYSLADKIPREALSAYYRYRSAIAAGDIDSAIVFLDVAIREANKVGVRFADAIKALELLRKEKDNEARNVEIVERFRDDAIAHLHAEQWVLAVAKLERATQIDHNDQAAHKLLDQIQGLLRAKSLTEKLNAGIGIKQSELATKTEIESILQNNIDSPFVSALWRDVAKGLGDFNRRPHGNKAIWQNLVISILVTIGLITSIFSLIYLLPRQTSVVNCEDSLSGLTATVNYPNYLVNGEYSDIEISIRNSSSSTIAISGTLIINLSGTASTQLTEPNNTNVFKFENLFPGEQITRSIRIKMNAPIKLITNPNLYTDFSILVAGNNDACIPSEFHIASAPIYKLRQGINLLWSSLGVAIVGLFWERLKGLLRLSLSVQIL